MNIPVKNGDLNENLSKEQKDAIANKSVDELAKHVFDTPKRTLLEDLNDSQDRIEKQDKEIIKQEEMSHPDPTKTYDDDTKEMKYPMTPQDLPENLDKTFLVEQDLYEFGVIAARLSMRGVSKDIIADTLINSMNYQSIAQIQGKFESYLREVKF